MAAIYERENVKVNVEAVRTVRALVRILKFYKDESGNARSDAEKTILLLSLNDALSQVYEVAPPQLFVDGTNCCYHGDTQIIHLNKPSIMSYLHEFRHHLQHTANKMFEGLSVEEDARAWSMRCFSKASPGNFLNSVKANKILFLKWDEENQCVIDDVEAIELNDTGSAEERLRAAMAGFMQPSIPMDSSGDEPALAMEMMNTVAALGEEQADEVSEAFDAVREEYDWRNDPNHLNNDQPNCGFSGGV